MAVRKVCAASMRASSYAPCSYEDALSTCSMQVRRPSIPFTCSFVCLPPKLLDLRGECAASPGTTALMKELGQSPVTLKKEANGFILNR